MCSKSQQDITRRTCNIDGSIKLAKQASNTGFLPSHLLPVFWVATDVQLLPNQADVLTVPPPNPVKSVNQTRQQLVAQGGVDA